MPAFTECQCQGDAGCPHHGEPERIQVMPDGTRLPIPDNPRFRWDSAFGAWCWVCDEGHEAWTLPHMWERMPQEWQSCCAVAVARWWDESDAYCEAAERCCTENRDESPYPCKDCEYVAPGEYAQEAAQTWTTESRRA